MSENPLPPEHDFALVLFGIKDIGPEVLDALFEAGCDDATVSLQCGRVYMTFSRRATSLKDAIISAIQNVRDAGIGADVLRVDDCNLVTQSDIARKTGKTRQQIHQYITGARGPGGFPPPGCELCEGNPLWYWCEVAYWLWENNMIKEDVLRDAEHVDVINTILEMQHQKKHNPHLAVEVAQALGCDCG